MTSVRGMAMTCDADPLPDEGKTAAIQQKLTEWFEANRRDLPWRRDRDPYKVWVSEIMLQQTQVDTVIPYFERFIERFPTVHALAAAAEEDVLKAWEGLGYYTRARHLHSAAKDVVELYGGVVPDDLPSISRLKGIGPYTAGAILSLAYGRREPAVDGNVMRVMARLFSLRDDIAKAATRVKIEALVRHLLPPAAPGTFNESLMELGALICTPRNPACLICPLLAECQAQKAGIHDQLPVKRRKPQIKSVSLVCGVIVRQGRVLVCRRPDRGLLAGMWEFPNTEHTEVSRLLPELGIAWGKRLGSVPHVFSHVKWLVHVYSGEVRGRLGHEVLPPGYKWVRPADLDAYAFPRVFHKVRELADGLF